MFIAKHIHSLDPTFNDYLRLSEGQQQIHCLFLAIACIGLIGTIVSSYSFLGKIGLYVFAPVAGLPLITSIPFYSISILQRVYRMNPVCKLIADFKMIEEELKENGCYNYLTLSVHLKKDALVKFLIELGEDINKPNLNLETPLHIAIRNEDVFMAYYLLENSADPNCLNSEGMTPLHLAAYLINNQLVQLLLDNHADP